MTDFQPEPAAEKASPDNDASISPAASGGQSSSVEATGNVKGGKASIAKKYWWVPAAFFLPFIATYLNLMSDLHARAEAVDKGVAIGAIGLAAAVLINVIWYLDCNYGARQFFSRSRDTAAKILICSLGLALWLTWTCVGIAMSMSYEQVNVPAIYH